MVVPDLPGLTEGKITPDTARETVEVAREVSARPDVEDREVALVGVSTGATLALLAAEKASLEGRVSVVAGIAPYSDIRTVVNIATTGHYRRSDGELIRYEADSFLPYVIAHSLVAALPPGEDRRTLSGELASIDREDPDPLSGLRSRRTDDLEPGARSVVGCSRTVRPERFAALYADLPDDVRPTSRALATRRHGKDTCPSRAGHRSPRQVLPSLSVVRARARRAPAQSDGNRGARPR